MNNLRLIGNEIVCPIDGYVSCPYHEEYIKSLIELYGDPRENLEVVE